MLRTNKRPRPIVLRVRQGDCLQITLTNYLQGNTANGTLQPITTNVSFHVQGMQVISSIASDGSLAGANTPPSGIVGSVAPGNQIIYTLYAAEPGSYLAYSTAAMAGGCGQCGGQLTTGLFGSVQVEPPGAEMYRSQITAADFAYATAGTTPLFQPKINYTARYPASYTPPAGAKAPQACWPVLAMVAPPATVQGGQCVVSTSGPLVTYYTDLTAMITGPNQGDFVGNSPEFNPVPASPNRRQPFREFVIHYHEVLSAVQAFTDYYKDNDTTGTDSSTLSAGKDNFAINYGTGGIGTEILANRINVGTNAGPPGSKQSPCVECKFEEFFLTAWAVGDPAMVVDVPANAPNTTPDPINQESATTKAMTACSLGTGPCTNVPLTGRKATRTYYPDDPSNVYHSYLNEHVKFRILHAGANFTHVHHQHAHQWLHSPNNPNGSYLDSQLISPGAAFTLEMVYNGSGNRNKTAGDSIFHCHFYPHFAAGMWSMWRVHDVYETGTPLSNGVPTGRALPDGEIASGTPIPAIVPLPTLAMPIMPAATSIQPVCQTGVSPCTNANAVGFQAVTTTAGNPGYPFFIPGVAGHRPPRPPLDIACENPSDPNTCYDGGLQRHLILTGTVTNQQQNQWDFSKDNTEFIQPGFTPPAGMPTGCTNGCLNAIQLPETGTPTELAAINYFGVRNHSSFTPTGSPGFFVTNGLPRKAAPYLNGAQPGAPFADPAVDDNGNAVGMKRRYKAAVVQTDLTFNKVGWHYPQQRFMTLWDDVQGAVQGGSSTYTPQPFFFRANSATDYVEFWHMNLVPSYYELDDYEVRTPTDILGQHIHLVKFDVTSSDGAANGFNYEDGTLSPDEVRDRIQAIRNWNGCTSYSPVSFQCPQAEAPPISATPPAGQDWTGAQVTVQRWYPDELTGCTDGRVPNCNQNADRTLRTVFTHDHFGPSTHQQVGLYAGLLIEPSGSTWTEPTTGVQLGTSVNRPSADGGPTSWQAIISATQEQPGYREFALEFQDLAHAYLPTSRTAPGAYSAYATGKIKLTDTAWGWADCANVVNGPGGGPTSGCTSNGKNVTPALIDTQQNVGSMLVNYRNEPLPFRVADPPPTFSNLSANATDLSFVYSSIQRNMTALNVQPAAGTCINGSSPPCPGGFVFPPPLPGAQPTDPYTPILQSYQGDNVQMRILVGAHFFNHNFDVQGLKWLFEPSNGSSGWRDNQAMGISEHFENLLTVPSTPAGSTPPPNGLLTLTDYLYRPGAGANDQIQGNWGLLRAYTTFGNASKVMPNLKTAPNNPAGGTGFSGTSICPFSGPSQTYYVAAISPQNTNITYYNRNGTTIQNQSPILYAATNSSGAMPSTPTAPIVLRANAGDCVNVVLFNLLDTTNPVFTTADTNYSGYPFTASGVSLEPSTSVGIHAQLVSVNGASQNGVNVGLNMAQYGATTIGPSSVTTNCMGVANGPPCIRYQWYAGNVTFNADGSRSGSAVEFGSSNLIASDPLEQQPHGMIGALIVEPTNTVWCNTAKTVCSKAMGTATAGQVFDTTADLYQNNMLQFREFVTMVQDNVYLSGGNFNAVNFGTEPFASRYSGYTIPSSCSGDMNCLDLTYTFSNSLPVSSGSSTLSGDPSTPIFTATAGTPVRFRMLHPDGLGGFPDNVYTLHGHVWQEEPYINDSSGNPSAVIGNNTLSQWMGARDGFGSGNKFDIVLPSAGGVNKVAGDYLYQSLPLLEGSNGVWGVFRVTAAPGATPATATPSAPVSLKAPRAHPSPDIDPGSRFLRPRDQDKSTNESERPEAPTKPPTGNEQ
jgi:hypothetical protein